MNNERNKIPSLRPTIENLSQAIFTVNRHAKTAPNPKFLYQLKHDAIKKMLREGKAKKTGLHFSNNPRNSQQQSDVLVVCGDYTFHIPPTKQDFEQLPHLGKLDQSVRNPRATISLTTAKRLLSVYTGLKESTETSGAGKTRKYTKPVFKKLGERYP
ncbi:YkyB family protein [Mesobacillus jeotgali]|uniref:YkyB family protein n=1 Tax=Mesobacillus jeotgali TaxID=129985 RepID=UPI001CFED302|nr:YkyB family protein [Mesobacillus jeotgali]